MIVTSKNDLEFHRETAKKCFNEAWNYLEKKKRDANDERTLLHLVHTSRYHWSIVGNVNALAVGDWQISRAYVALNQPQLALHFANSALEIMRKNNLADFLCSGYEGIAHAYAVAKEYQSARDYIKKAREQLNRASGLDDEDKKIFSDQIQETEQLIKQ